MCRKTGVTRIVVCKTVLLQFAMSADEEEFFRIAEEESEKEFDPADLVYPKEVPVFEECDEYVPDELARKGYAYGVLDIKEMKSRGLSWNDGIIGNRMIEPEQEA